MRRKKHFADRPLETCTGDPGKNWGLAIWPLAGIGNGGGGGGRVSGDGGRRRRGARGGGAQGSGEGPRAAFGWSWGGRRRAGHGALLQAAMASGGGGAPAVVSGGEGGRELQCIVGKLATGLIGAEEGRGGVLHGEQGAAAAAVAGGCAPVGIRWWLGAGEHEQVMGKLARGSVGAMGNRRRRSTTASSSPDWRKGRQWCSGVRGAVQE
jgi:hypothetical protein